MRREEFFLRCPFTKQKTTKKKKKCCKWKKRHNKKYSHSLEPLREKNIEKTSPCPVACVSQAQKPKMKPKETFLNIFLFFFSLLFHSLWSALAEKRWTGREKILRLPKTLSLVRIALNIFSNFYFIVSAVAFPCSQHSPAIASFRADVYVFLFYCSLIFYNFLKSLP